MTNYDDVLGEKKEAVKKAKKESRYKGGSLRDSGIVAGKTENEEKLTRIKIYAKEIYGIPYAEFTMDKLVKKAEIELGIDNPKTLIPMAERKKNFEILASNSFYVRKELDEEQKQEVIDFG